MCCLFGFIDYGHQLSRKARHRLLTVLSTACEERGTDATGIAYNVDGRQRIFKRPIPAHLMWYRVPVEATTVMGHTRMTTQGSARRNENNHPFRGRAGNTSFALAHNGILYNDRILRKEFKLPGSRIETDSYVAVQLLEKFGRTDFEGLRAMAEELEGSFTITALTERDELYFVKGNNPMCIYHYPKAGLYVYASTEEILRKAMVQAKLRLGKAEKVNLFSGEILRIDAKGSHCLCLMTLAELRAWNEGKAILTDEEKQLYAARSGCSYDVFEELASERLMHLEITSWRQKSHRRKQENKELRSYLQELERKGKAITKDGKCYIVPSENTVFYV